MVTSLMASGEFAVMVNAKRNGIEHQLSIQHQMTFMDAADQAIQSQGYFRFAILDHDEWDSVIIEIGDRNGTIQMIEITRN
jgi:hypothetical protein